MWIEIFKTGTWTSSQGKTKTYTKDDLDKIVSKFDPNQKPPVTVGHPEKDTAPAYGWMKALKRVGEVLMGDFDFIPEFMELLKKGVYKNRSIGLRDGAINHVAFLGGWAPAVSGLDDIKFSADDAESEYYETTLEKENEMEKEIQEKIAALEAENAKMKADYAASQKEIASMKAERREKEVDEFCASLVENGQVTPAAAENIKKTLHGFCGNEDNFAEGGAVEEIKKMYSGLPKMEHLEPDVANKKNAKKGNTDAPASYFGRQVDPESYSLDQRATEIMESHKVDYATAVNIAIREA